MEKNWFQSFKEMVATCLVKDPKKRPSSEKLLKHPFFKHARSVDYLARTILDGLDPLGDRFKKLKVPSSSQAFLLLALIVLWKLWIVCSTCLVCRIFFTGKRGWSSGTKQGFVWRQGAFITGSNYKTHCLMHASANFWSLWALAPRFQSVLHSTQDLLVFPPNLLLSL